MSQAYVEGMYASIRCAKRRCCGRCRIDRDGNYLPAAANNQKASIPSAETERTNVTGLFGLRHQFPNTNLQETATHPIGKSLIERGHINQTSGLGHRLSTVRTREPQLWRDEADRDRNELIVRSLGCFNHLTRPKSSSTGEAR